MARISRAEAARIQAEVDRKLAARRKPKSPERLPWTQIKPASKKGR